MTAAETERERVARVLLLAGWARDAMGLRAGDDPWVVLGRMRGDCWRHGFPWSAGDEACAVELRALAQGFPAHAAPVAMVAAKGVT